MLEELKNWIKYYRASLIDTSRGSKNSMIDGFIIRNDIFLDVFTKEETKKIWDEKNTFNCKHGEHVPENFFSNSYYNRSILEDIDTNDVKFVKIEIAPVFIQNRKEHSVYTGNNKIYFPFWIPAYVREDGVLFPPLDDEKPIFLRENLSPNPHDSPAIAELSRLDSEESNFQIRTNTWVNYWQDCEKYFNVITEKKYEDFQSSVFKCKIAKYQGNNMITNLLKIYNDLIKNHNDDIENYPIYNYAKLPINTKEDFYSLPNEIKITCLTKNIRNSEIKVLADGKDAGFLNIYANMEQEIKIILISVKADFGHPIGEKEEKNKGKIRGKEEFKKVLNSIGIRPTFEEIELDLTKTRNGLYENTDLKNASIINGAGDLKVLSGNVKGKDFDEYLEDEFKNRIKDSNGNFLYDNYLRIYYVNQVAKMWVAGGEGQVGGKGEINKGVCVMYVGGTLIDVVHESLHALGLGHSFSAKDVKPEQKFVYKYAKTDNYMDYGHLGNPVVIAVSLWKWQWDMLIGKSKTTTAQRLITVSKSKIPTS